MNTDNPELELAYNFVQYTNRNLFLTGKAGTGKTTFLQQLKTNSQKRMVVVAPTGVAAINAGGVTIHSFFQMPFGPILPENYDQTGDFSRNSLLNRKFNKKKITIIKTMDLLVIDEISMVRADLLDGIDQVLRRYRDRTKMYGGVQVLMIGDLQQLAPIIKPDEWLLLKPHYETGFFFSSHVFQQANTLCIELKHIYRQSNEKFIKILNEIRDDRLSELSVGELNKRYISDYIPEKEDGYITLTTHNAKAQRINNEQLERVKSKKYSFESEVKGVFPEYSYPTEETLSLKIGAQVMFVKNDSAQKKEYYNGKIGIITAIADDVIHVTCPDELSPVIVGMELWENFKYSINEKTKEIEEEVVGSFLQYPLRLAWAITIHKSQGLTFEKAIIDAGASFAHGQTYVALSRCKSLKGVILSSKITPAGIICDPTVVQFNKQIEENPANNKDLFDSRVAYQFFLLDELFDYMPLRSFINRCLYLLQQHKRGTQGNLSDTLNAIQQTTIAELIRIASSFARQLQSLMVKGQDMESNAVIQERIKKACIYYADQTTTHISGLLDEATFATDNQSTQKIINDALIIIREELIFKSLCIEACKHGFRVQDYLRSRAMAFFKKQTSKTAAKIKVKDLTSNHPELLNRLQSWRKRCAETECVPLSRVTTQKALVGISNQLPGNRMQLKIINGMGKKRVAKYGDDILEMVLDFCSEKKLKSSVGNIDVKTPEQKGNSRPSMQQNFDF